MLGIWAQRNVTEFTKILQNWPNGGHFIAQIPFVMGATRQKIIGNFTFLLVMGAARPKIIGIFHCMVVFSRAYTIFEENSTPNLLFFAKMFQNWANPT